MCSNNYVHYSSLSNDEVIVKGFRLDIFTWHDCNPPKADFTLTDYANYQYNYFNCDKVMYRYTASLDMDCNPILSSFARSHPPGQTVYPSAGVCSLVYSVPLYTDHTITTPSPLLL